MWSDKKDLFLEQSRKEIFIWRNILYRSAQYYKIRNRWTGWPPSFMAGLLSILKSADFMEMDILTIQTLKVISLLLTLLIFIWTTIHVLLGYQKKMQKSKDLADNLYDIEHEITLILAKNYEERKIEPNTFIEKIKNTLSDYNRNMGILPKSIYDEYYPNSRSDLNNIIELLE